MLEFDPTQQYGAFVTTKTIDGIGEAYTLARQQAEAVVPLSHRRKVVYFIVNDFLRACPYSIYWAYNMPPSSSYFDKAGIESAATKVEEDRANG